MAAFVELVTDPTGWHTSTALGLRAPSLEVPADRPVSRRDMVPRDRRSTLLNRVVQAEILPRIALARRAAACRKVSVARTPATMAQDVAELVQRLLFHDAVDVIGFVETLRLRGATADSLYLGVLSDAARRLGDLWFDDRCDFAQITIGMGWLQQALRALSQSFQGTAVSPSDAKSVLLLPAPGEQHTFGLLMLAEYFRRSGWHVAGGPVSSGIDSVEAVRHAWFDVAAFSIGSEALLGGLARCIRRVRWASRNRNLGVMVGGPLFLQRPDLVGRAGADVTAADAPGAVRQADGLLAMRAAAE
jgi:MerR family transcriptional regulator, light-induced transcriptional regulator